MAARVDPRHVPARHQSMHHFIAEAPWDAAAVLRVARDWVLGPMVRHGPVVAWIVDDTGFPKKGPHSVGVARQYCGVLGKQDNCQVAVSVSVANEAVSLPVAYQLYLPESWARGRRRAVGVPEAVSFQPKWQIALGQIQTLQGEGLPQAPVVADAGYGDTTAFRDALTSAGLPYVVGVKGETTAWPPGAGPRPPRRDALPLRAAAPATGPSRCAARGASAGRMAAHRMAAGRRRAHEVLALDSAGADPDRRPRPPGQAPLAHRARLSGAQ